MIEIILSLLCKNLKLAKIPISYPCFNTIPNNDKSICVKNENIFLTIGF